MGAALFIALDNPNPGFDVFVNGKAISRESDNLNRVCTSIGPPSLDEFINMSSDELADMLGDDFDIPEIEESWFDVDEGLRIFGALRAHLQEHPDAIASSEAVLDELGEYITVLEQARAINAKWHLSVDV